MSGLRDWARRRPFLTLLIALALLLTSYPVQEGSDRARVVFQALFDLVLFAGLFALRDSRVWFWVAFCVVVPSAASFWASLAFPESALANSLVAQVGAAYGMGAFLVLLVVFILRDLFSTVDVTGDRLCGALSAYFMLGLAFGFFYTGLELAVPGSFDVGLSLGSAIRPTGPELAHRSSYLFYYSFVTLTTLGFGDITPVRTGAQMLTMWEAILGQAYLTILVARLVGLHVMAARPSDGD